MVEYWNVEDPAFNGVDLTKEVAYLLTSLSRKIFSIDQFSARLFTHYSITPVFQYSNCERSELSSAILRQTQLRPLSESSLYQIRGPLHPSG